MATEKQQSGAKKGCKAAGRNTMRCKKYELCDRLGRNKDRNLKRHKKHLEKARLRHLRNGVVSGITKREARFIKNHAGQDYWEACAKYRGYSGGDYYFNQVNE